MKIYFDDWSTCYDDSGFTIDMEVVPRVGETVRIHRSLMNERFFRESPYVGEHGLVINADGYVEGEVNVVEHVVGPDGQCVHIDLNFLDR